MLIAWGARFLFHRGEERSFGRVIFAPIAVALASVYASTHVPGSDWTHSFGLGGLFGDTVLGAILGVVPIKATLGLKVMALLMALGTLAMSLFVLGFTLVELRRIGRFLGIGVIMAYATLLRLTGKGAIGACGRTASARTPSGAAVRTAEQSCRNGGLGVSRAATFRPCPTVVRAAPRRAPLHRDPAGTARRTHGDGPQFRWVYQAAGRTETRPSGAGSILAETRAGCGCARAAADAGDGGRFR